MATKKYNSRDRFASKIENDPYVKMLFERKLQRIDFQHLPTGEIVRFPAFLTDFSQTFNSDWKSTDVYGRMDDIPIFKKTSRTISVGWDVPAWSLRDAEQNMEAVNLLTQMLYPVYDTVQARSFSNVASFNKYISNTIGNKRLPERVKQSIYKGIGAKVQFKGSISNLYGTRGITLQTGGYNVDGGVLKAAPLMKVKLQNLITNTLKDLPQGVGISGVVGKISSLSINPVLEVGFFDPDVFILPKLIRISIGYDVVHGHQVGWSSIRNNFLGGREFPLGETRTERDNRKLRD